MGHNGGLSLDLHPINRDEAGRKFPCLIILGSIPSGAWYNGVVISLVSLMSEVVRLGYPKRNVGVGILKMPRAALFHYVIGLP